ncbi:hypothetical protein [Desulfurobacterium crinifex]
MKLAEECSKGKHAEFCQKNGALIYLHTMYTILPKGAEVFHQWPGKMKELALQTFNSREWIIEFLTASGIDKEKAIKAADRVSSSN